MAPIGFKHWSRAYIDGDNAAGITAATVDITADDSSGINAIAGAISIAGAVGLVGSGALSVGLSPAQMRSTMRSAPLFAALTNRVIASW